MKKYAIISNKKRNQLIDRVVQNGESVSRVAKQLRMKLPSAKSIIRTYKKCGKVFDKKKAINRKLRCRKIELSQTENANSCQILKETVKKTEKNQEKVEKMQQVLDQKNHCIKMETKLFESPTNMKDLTMQYYTQFYLSQQRAYYYNLVQYLHNLGISSVKL